MPAAYVVSARQAAQDDQEHDVPARHDHSSHQEPLLCSRLGAHHSTGGDEGDIAEAGGDRELLMSAAAHYVCRRSSRYKQISVQFSSNVSSSRKHAEQLCEQRLSWVIL